MSTFGFMKFKNLLTLLTVCCLFACGEKPKNESEKQIDTPDSTAQVPAVSEEAAKFIQSVENKHRKEQFESKEVVQFDLDLSFGGKKRFLGTLSMTPNGGLVRMEDSSKVMIWDGKEAYLSPESSTYTKTRFDVLTWSYFFAAAYKMSDPGVNHNYLGDDRPLNRDNYSASQMTFAENVGDSPEDWYIAYMDNKENLLVALAYIVTYNTDVKKASEDPHAITYEAFIELEGIPFATQWNFWTWNWDGQLSKLLGTASVSNIKFIKKAEDLFQPSASFKKVKK